MVSRLEGATRYTGSVSHPQLWRNPVLHDIANVRDKIAHLLRVRFPQPESPIAASAQESSDSSRNVVVVNCEADCYGLVTTNGTLPVLRLEHGFVLSGLQPIPQLNASLVCLSVLSHAPLRRRYQLTPNGGHSAKCATDDTNEK